MSTPYVLLPSSRSAMHGVLRRRSGFTIVELLVATAITLVVIALMVQITFSTLRTFDKVTGTLNSKAEAQRIFDYIRRDFSALIWRRDENVWLLATVQREQDAINAGKGDADVGSGSDVADWASTNPKPGNLAPSTAGSSLRLQKSPSPGTAADRWQDLSEYRFGQAGVWLRFFANQTTSLTPTQPAPIAVSYQIVRMKPQPNNTAREYRYLFFRSVVRPAPTAATTRSVLDSGFDLTVNPAATVDRYNEPTNTNSGNLEPGGVRTPDRTVILANNIVDFGIRFWRRDATTGRDVLIFPANAAGLPDNTALGYAATMRLPGSVTNTGGAETIPFGNNLTTNGFNTAAEQNVGFPDYAEVMVRILTDEGARTVAAFENGDITAPTPTGNPPSPAENDEYWWTLVEQNSVVYVDTIPLPSRPL